MAKQMYPTGMTRVVGGKQYSVDSATLLADNAYWDGSSFDRGGRNTFLFRTPKGAFFKVTMSMWQGERDNLQPVSEAEAKWWYEGLQDHAVAYEEAFPGATVEEA